jgi:hypothetical protein
MEDMGGAMLNEVGAMAQEGAQRHQVRFGPKGGRQQAIAVQGLNPLAVQHITFPSGDPLEGLSTDQAAVETAGFKFLKQWNPIHAGGFHGACLDVTVHKPVCQRLQIRSVRAKGTHDLLVLAVRYASHDLMRANVDASGVGVDLAHSLERPGFAMGGAGTMTFTQFAHGGLLVRSRSIT